MRRFTSFDGVGNLLQVWRGSPDQPPVALLPVNGCYVTLASMGHPDGGAGWRGGAA